MGVSKAFSNELYSWCLRDDFRSIFLPEGRKKRKRRVKGLACNDVSTDLIATPQNSVKRYAPMTAGCGASQMDSGFLFDALGESWANLMMSTSS